ncbi:MAG: hypothetical protein Kow0045_12480 [Albidovulum sp.]
MTTVATRGKFREISMRDPHFRPDGGPTGATAEAAPIPASLAAGEG